MYWLIVMELAKRYREKGVRTGLVAAIVLLDRNKSQWCTLAQLVALFQQKYFSAEKAREWPRIGD